MHIITALLEGKNLNYAIDKAAVDASVRSHQPGALLTWLSSTNHDRQPNHTLPAAPRHQNTPSNVQRIGSGIADEPCDRRRDLGWGEGGSTPVKGEITRKTEATAKQWPKYTHVETTAQEQ